MTDKSDPAALRAQSLDVTRQALAEYVLEYCDHAGQPQQSHLLVCRPCALAFMAVTEKARDCYLAQRDAANEQMRRLMDEHEAVRDRAEEAEKARDNFAQQAGDWQIAANDQEQRAIAAEGLLREATEELRLDVMVRPNSAIQALLARIDAFLAGPASPPPLSAQQQEGRGEQFGGQGRSVKGLSAEDNPTSTDEESFSKGRPRPAGPRGSDAGNVVEPQLRSGERTASGTLPSIMSAQQQEEPRCNCPDIGWARDCPKHGPEERKQETLSGATAPQQKLQEEIARLTALLAQREPLPERDPGTCRRYSHGSPDLAHWKRDDCVDWIAVPCPHARPTWRMCPHCLGINQGTAADRPPPALPVEQNMAPDGASLGLPRASPDSGPRQREEGPATAGEPAARAARKAGDGHPPGPTSGAGLVGSSFEERARSAPPALPSAAASAEKQEGWTSGLILPNDEKHGAWCIFDGPQWGCDFCCEPEGRVIEALRSEARICSACVSLAGDLEPRERASPEAPPSTENTSGTPK